ncbi:MAG: hypothetical protein GXY36_03490 [Chloroflexi bacterium]|nr:hypothetical protein [Chloroflexota bacterium]
MIPTLHSISSRVPPAIWRTGGWLVRLLIVLIALRPITPAPAHVTLGPPQTVETQHPAVCVHTRLTDEVEEWKVQRTLSMVREMGASTIVEFFPWPYAEHDEGRYDWAHFDRIMLHARNQGLSVIARLGLVPDWARPPVVEKVTTLTYLTEDYYDEFVDFVRAFVARYGDEIVGVIIWNEPNLGIEWGNRPVDPEAYTGLLRQSYTAAHAANPDVVVMGGALAPTVNPDASGSALSDVDFLERMYEAGAKGYFDALAVHTYGFTRPAQDPPDPDVVNFRRVELLREVMARYGDDATPVYITESGWNDDPRWTNAVRPGQRIVYTLEAFEMVEAWPWTETLCLWNFRIPFDLNNRRDAYYALVSSDFHIRPVYEAVQAYARGWESPYLP